METKIQFPIRIFFLTVFFACISCTSTPNTPAFTATSRFHAQNVPNGSLRVGEVMDVGTRSEILQGGWAYDVLNNAGISDAEIRDGSVIISRVFCCGGPNEEATAILSYVPTGVAVEAGDIVEIWSGEMLKEGQALGAMPNTVTRVLESRAEFGKACRWTPDDPDLWVRVIYCNWMPQEGWIQQSGLYPLWVNPISALNPPI